MSYNHLLSTLNLYMEIYEALDKENRELLGLTRYNRKRMDDYMKAIGDVQDKIRADPEFQRQQQIADKL